jgi:hypothetical protein
MASKGVFTRRMLVKGVITLNPSLQVIIYLSTYLPLKVCQVVQFKELYNHYFATS